VFSFYVNEDLVPSPESDIFRDGQARVMCFITRCTAENIFCECKPYLSRYTVDLEVSQIPVLVSAC
jgi:hypothetical protein